MTGKILNGVAAASVVSAILSFGAFYLLYASQIKNKTSANGIVSSDLLLKCIYFIVPLLVATLLISFMVSYILAKKISRDVENMGDDIEHISANCTYDELKPFADKVQLQLDEKEKLLNMKKRFTANVSHELKTPLTSISGYGEMLEQNMIAPEDIPKIGGVICKESQRLINLTHDIIQLSQLEEYDYKPIIDFVELMPVINYCADALSVMAQKKNVSIHISGFNCKIKGTKALLEELVYNLVENAIKYNTDGGSVDITVQDKDNFICLTVKDTGIGIPKKYQDRIFERFFRVDKSRSKETGGTGLGLAIVKHTAEYLGGSVSLESDENKGTSIIVMLAK